MPYTKMLNFCMEQGISALEIETGNWFSAPHIDLDTVLSSETTRIRWYDEMRRRGLALCALNCSGRQSAL